MTDLLLISIWKQVHHKDEKRKRERERRRRRRRRRKKHKGVRTVNNTSADGFSGGMSEWCWREAPTSISVSLFSRSCKAYFSIKSNHIWMNSFCLLHFSLFFLVVLFCVIFGQCVPLIHYTGRYQFCCWALPVAYFNCASVPFIFHSNLTIFFLYWLTVYSIFWWLVDGGFSSAD